MLILATIEIASLIELSLELSVSLTAIYARFRLLTEHQLT